MSSSCWTPGWLSLSPICTQAQLDAGQCSLLCPTGGLLRPPPRGRSGRPSSTSSRRAIHTVLVGTAGIQFGFAHASTRTSSRSAPSTGSYQADSRGPTIPGWGPYPAAGAQEVFGLSWAYAAPAAATIGAACSATQPADLPERLEARPRPAPAQGGRVLQPIRHLLCASGRPRLQDAPTRRPVLVRRRPVPGSPTVNVNVRLDRCNNLSCSAYTTLGQTVISWSRMANFISWENVPGPAQQPPAQLFLQRRGGRLGIEYLRGMGPEHGHRRRFLERLQSPPHHRHLGSSRRELLPGRRGAVRLDQRPQPWTFRPGWPPNPGVVPTFGIAAYFQDSRLGSETFLAPQERPRQAADRQWLDAAGQFPAAPVKTSYATGTPVGDPRRRPAIPTSPAAVRRW